MTMETQDDKLKTVPDRPWLEKPANRLPFSLFFVLVALFLIKPLIVNRLVARADAYASYGLYNNCARECKKAIFIDNKNDAAWNALGNSYKNQGDLENAVNTYLNAINANPNNKIAHFRVAMVFTLQQNYNRSIQHFEYIRSLGPESKEELSRDLFSYHRSSMEMLALCYERTGKLDKMQAVLESLAKIYPDYTKTRDELNIPLSISEDPNNP